MTQEISSLMDGELDSPEAVRAIQSCCQNRELEEKWHLYHVIGDAMRGQAPRSLARRVGILDKEPAIIARPRGVLDTTFGRVALAAAASVATIGVVGWIGSQGMQGPAAGPAIAKNTSPIQPVASTATTVVTVPTAPVADVQDYLAAHRQLPSPELYRPVNNRAAAGAR
jgi:sigma-E factor negative regulatory protein RseA